MWTRAAVLALAMLGTLPGLAQAADDLRDGSVDDPAGDASIAYSGAGTAARLLDVRSARVTYDAGLGSVSVTFAGDIETGPGRGVLNLYATASAPNERGECDDVRRSGDVQISGYVEGGHYSYVSVYDDRGGIVATGTADVPPGGGVRMTGVSSYLIRRDLRCARDLRVVKYAPSYLDGSTDGVANFCIGTPSGTCPVGPAIAAPGLVANGSQLTWSKVGASTSYVVATSQAPEGSEGRKTTYQVVSGTTFTPPAAAGTTRWYSVRVNDDGALWARPEATITFPGAAPATTSTAAPTIQASGTRLTWSKVGEYASYVVAMSTAPEGAPGRQTTYQVVTGTSYNPAGTAGTTRWYGVRANVEGSQWSSPEALVTFVDATPTPLPPFTVAQPTVPVPVPVSGTGVVAPVSGGSAVPAPVSSDSRSAQTVPSLRLSVSDARTIARRALAKRYGRAFTLQKRGSLRIGCASLSATKVRCDLRWRYGRSTYAGTVTVTRKASGDAPVLTIKRRTTPVR